MKYRCDICGVAMTPDANGVAPKHPSVGKPCRGSGVRQMCWKEVTPGGRPCVKDPDHEGGCVGC
jgi:hypothetical protein